MEKINNDTIEQEKFFELSYYTLAHPDPSFIHQHVVDAYAAQNADENTKSIKISFALIGLYLYLEKNYTGRQVQKTHMYLAKKKRRWLNFHLPDKRGNVKVSDVLAAHEGKQRDEMINKWCASVWDAYKDHHKTVADLLNNL